MNIRILVLSKAHLLSHFLLSFVYIRFGLAVATYAVCIVNRSYLCEEILCVLVLWLFVANRVHTSAKSIYLTKILPIYSFSDIFLFLMISDSHSLDRICQGSSLVLGGIPTFTKDAY